MSDRNDIRIFSQSMQDCTGCALCTLPCPVWNQDRDLLKTFCGRMRSLQGGAEPEDIESSLRACILCGSCAPVCSFGIDTLESNISLRSSLKTDASSSEESVPKVAPAKGRILLAGGLLTENEELKQKTLKALGNGTTIYGDSGDDITEALETCTSLPQGRIQGFVSSIESASEVITTEGLIYRLIRQLRPRVKVLGIGEALIRYTGLAARLNSDDLYVIDSRTYHTEFDRLVQVYDRMKRDTGCMMNLDLNRIATPTGATHRGSGRISGAVDPVKQAQWILLGRPASRIIVERPEDVAPFREASDVPVVFISELLDQG
jgi:heterodisulfide reductase subunit C